MEIISLQNERVKNWLKLKEKKYRDETNTFLVEGNHLVEEAIKYGKVKEIILLNEMEYNSDLPVYFVAKEIIGKLSSQVTPANIFAVVEKLTEQEYTNKILILDQIQDPGNLGTIIRSASAFGFGTILCSLDTVDLYNEKVIRSTEGMFFGLNILKRDLEREIAFLKENKYTIYGTNVLNGKELDTVKPKEKMAIIIGNEGKGMNPCFQKFIDEFIYIPMNSKCESLNAGVSASIIMYEMRNINE